MKYRMVVEYIDNSFLKFTCDARPEYSQKGRILVFKECGVMYNIPTFNVKCIKLEVAND